MTDLSQKPVYGEQGYEVGTEDGLVALGAHDGWEGVDLRLTPGEARALAAALLNAANEVTE
jgi:hypothetical protein